MTAYLPADLRVLVGDTDEVVFEDDSLTLYLTAADGNIYRAAGIAFATLAAQYAQVGRSVKTSDLAIDTTSRGESLLAVSKSFFVQADELDKAEANSIFDVVGDPGVDPNVWRTDHPIGWWF